MATEWRGSLVRESETTWIIPSGYKRGMLVDGIIYSDDSLMEAIAEDQAPEQVANVACLPGIVKASLAMPDIHWGYGFPIGGVAATRLNDGVIVPGGIGYDINCGVRLHRSTLTEKTLKDKMDRLMDTLFCTIPLGVGSKGSIRLGQKALDEVLAKGARWAVENGYGTNSDLRFCEEQGSMEVTGTGFVSDKARKRGLPQLGTLGSGNHFIEVDVVREVFDEKIADAYKLKEGMVVFQIHSGSRGLGHQVCADHLRAMAYAMRAYDLQLPDQQLACAPIRSPEGKAYFSAMACAANFAWANRQCLTYALRNAVAEAVDASVEGLQMEMVYDVSHNIARMESHKVDGNDLDLCVHRKGATRAFGPGHASLPREYLEVGQPVLVPGDMGRRSYVLAGTDQAMAKTFGSTCHGAGRVLSRSAAKKAVRGSDIRRSMESRGIRVRAGSDAALAEEASDAYKDIASVVDVVVRAGLSKPVVLLKPLGVIKG